jgi:hypothetical protein
MALLEMSIGFILQLSIGIPANLVMLLPFGLLGGPRIREHDAAFHAPTGRDVIGDNGDLLGGAVEGVRD